MKYEKPLQVSVLIYVYIFLEFFADVVDNKRINQVWKQIQ